MNFELQIEAFKSLGYEFPSDVTKDVILSEVYERTWEEETEKYIENTLFSILYYLYGWRSPDLTGYNYTDDCISFDLDFFDPNSQYKWFMERMGIITHGEIEFSDISIETDAENWEWSAFKVNGVQKKWKLEKAGYIADHFVQRFSYLPKEFNTKGQYTYYSDGGQQWVIDYATQDKQTRFQAVTGLKREWLGRGNHFSTPDDLINLQSSAQNKASDGEGDAKESDTQNSSSKDKDLKVRIHISGIGAGHESVHGYREVVVDSSMSFEAFIQYALGFEGAFLASEYYVQAPDLCAVMIRQSSGFKVICKKNIILNDLVIEGKPLTVSFGINELNEATIDYRMKVLIAQGVKRLDDVEAAWLGMPVGTTVDNFPERLAGYPAIQAVLRDHKNSNEEPSKEHWVIKLNFILRLIRLLISPFR